MLTSFRKTHYAEFAAAYVRGIETDAPQAADELEEFARRKSINLDSFRRTPAQPPLPAVLELLYGLWPESLLDIGSGTGTFLWPLLANLPHIDVCACDIDPDCISRIETVNRGGLDYLTGCCLDARSLPFDDDSFDAVTLLEILEHIDRPEAAAAEAFRVARKMVIASVPSQEDDNPEHLRFFSQKEFVEMFRKAGAKKLSLEFINRHKVLVVRKNGASA